MSNDTFRIALALLVTALVVLLCVIAAAQEFRFPLVEILIGLYLLPTFVAGYRKHRSSGSIVALNILAGWTGIGWIASLVWSLKTEGV